MKTMFWLAVAVSAVALALVVRYLLRKHTDRERAAEARAAEFLVQMAAAKPPVAASTMVAAQAQPKATAPATRQGPLEMQKLLFDAARKAGDAGEPALAVELYARLLARFPDSAFASEARAATEAQKKLIKA